MMVKLRVSEKPLISTLHCMLEIGSDLHVNECQKIQHYCTRFTEE